MRCAATSHCSLGSTGSWRRIVQPIIDAAPEPYVYERGSMGPKEADELLGPDWEWLSAD